MLNLELRAFGLAPKFVCDMSFAPRSLVRECKRARN